MDTIIIIAFLVILGSILGVLVIGSIIKRNPDAATVDIPRKVVELMQVKEHDPASSLFRSAFEDEILVLKDLLVNVPETTEDIISLLRRARNKHYHAYIRFRPYLSDSLQSGFDQAWKEYCCPQGGDPEKESDPFLEYKMEGLQPIDSVKLAINNMEKLLGFVAI